MAKNIFKEVHFHDENAARAWFEAARWPNGPVCPHCKGEKHYATKATGRYRCANKECRKDFTVMTGSVMERSHAKLTQWAAAFTLAASSKKGFSAISSTAPLAASTTRLGSCITASWKPCGGAISISPHGRRRPDCSGR
jgi:transposase-like protein